MAGVVVSQRTHEVVVSGRSAANATIATTPVVLGGRGPAGPRGKEGERGPAGVQGEQGLQGEKGEVGPAGERTQSWQLLDKKDVDGYRYRLYTRGVEWQIKRGLVDEYPPDTTWLGYADTSDIRDTVWGNPGGYVYT